MAIIYRAFQPGDAAGVKRIMNEDFHIYRFAPAPVPQRDALELNLRDTLGAATWAQVAVDEGRIVGVLIGHRHGGELLPDAARNRITAAGLVARLALTRLPQCFGLLQYARLFGLYAKLNRNHPSPLTDEIKLFAVDPSTQGKGVGSTLFANFVDHLAQHGRTDYFLYTDSMCSYYFYDRRGMTRVGTEHIRFRVEGIPEKVEVYLYTGKVPQSDDASPVREPAVAGRQ